MQGLVPPGFHLYRPQMDEQPLSNRTLTLKTEFQTPFMFMNFSLKLYVVHSLLSKEHLL